MSHFQKSLETVELDVPATGVGRITMNRPEQKNAQNVQMTYDMDEGFETFCRDDKVKVIVLAGAGDVFSAGHDLSPSSDAALADQASKAWQDGFGARGYEAMYSREKEIYFEATERWRNAPKPTIAQIQGPVFAGGNMLVGCCDLVVAADDTRFMDNTLAMGINGVEYFPAPLHMGFRRAKEWLFATEWFTAEQALQCGLVNRVVPRDELEAEVLKLAAKITTKSRFALKLAKENFNKMEDAMGRKAALDYHFLTHQLLHAHWLLESKFPLDASKLPKDYGDFAQALLERLGGDPAEFGRVFNRGADAFRPDDAT